jgi:hypothetical protein
VFQLLHTDIRTGKHRGWRINVANRMGEFFKPSCKSATKIVTIQNCTNKEINVFRSVVNADGQVHKATLYRSVTADLPIANCHWIHSNICCYNLVLNILSLPLLFAQLEVYIYRTWSHTLLCNGEKFLTHHLQEELEFRVVRIYSDFNWKSERK